MALGSIQLITTINTNNISWEVKTTGTYSCEPYQLHMLIFLESGILNLLEPSRPAQACTGIANSQKKLLPLITYWTLTTQRFMYVKFLKLNSTVNKYKINLAGCFNMTFNMDVFTQDRLNHNFYIMALTAAGYSRHFRRNDKLNCVYT